MARASLKAGMMTMVEGRLSIVDWGLSPSLCGTAFAGRKLQQRYSFLVERLLLQQYG
jgi:hypothetical protein